MNKHEKKLISLLNFLSSSRFAEDHKKLSRKKATEMKKVLKTKLGSFDDVKKKPKQNFFFKKLFCFREFLLSNENMLFCYVHHIQDQLLNIQDHYYGQFNGKHFVFAIFNICFRCLTAIWNSMLLPVTQYPLPCSFDPDGLPTGIQIVAGEGLDCLHSHHTFF